MNLAIADQQVRNDILENGISNTVVSASAGAGKTTIMIEKIKRVLDIEKTHKTIAAITFTIKATSEIKERLRNINSKKEITISTNDRFVESEIIRPFLSDTAFGKGLTNDFIITYSGNIEDFEEGIKKLKEENVLGSYRNNLKKNFKFELAKRILLDSIAARQYLESKYSMLFLDEYQDSDSEMHDLFMYIKNELKIKLFIVGDAKQAIYIWRGAHKNIFNLLKQEKFNEYVLTHNFRCHPEITNFANFIHHFEHFKSSKSIVSNMVLCRTQLTPAACLESLILSGVIDKRKEITVLINVNGTAELFSQKMRSLGYDFVFIPKTPIDEGLLNSYLLRQLAKLYFDPFFSIYEFCEVLKIDNEPKLITAYEKIFRPLIKREEIEYDKIKKMCNEFSERLEFVISENEIKSLTETLINKEFEICFTRNGSKLRVMTVFASKGLEFDQVIAFARDYNLTDDERRNNHYVAITRAKEKMIIIDNTVPYVKNLVEIFRNQGVKNKVEIERIVNVINV